MKEYVLFYGLKTNRYWYGYFLNDSHYWSGWCNTIPETVVSTLRKEITCEWEEYPDDRSLDDFLKVAEENDIQLKYRSTKPLDIKELENTNPELFI